MYRVIIFLILFFIALPSYAHKPSDSYINLFRSGDEIHAQWDISLRDLDYAIGLDSNEDGAITWGELKSKHRQIENYALPHIRLKTKEGEAEKKLIGHEVDYHTDGAYEVLNFKIIPKGTNKLPILFDLEYDLFFDIDPQHKGLLNIKHKGNTLSRIFSSDVRFRHINLNVLSPWTQFLEYIKEGIWHIWIGFDHILFLLALLLPSVLMRKNNTWVPVSDFKSAFRSVVEIVTAFTLAHSVTLSLFVLGFINVPSRLVESLIALSVVLAALNNLFPIVKDGRWIVAFFFGLIHGCGFGSVLLDLGLTEGNLFVSLFGFNLGVEIGQLVIVSIFLPLAYYVCDTTFYKKLVFVSGSSLIVVVAFLWFIERAFDLSFMPF